MDYKAHYSVLLKECVDYLVENGPGTFFDGTFGGGGHSFALLENNPQNKVIATDQDPQAYENGLKRIEKSNVSDRIQLLKMNFASFPEYFKSEMKNDHLNGAVMDLGVSSHHFDSPERGFSFRFDGPLDMRMSVDSDELINAEDILNNYSEEDLADLIYKYGEERYSRRIAKEIIEQRGRKRIETTKELENIIFHCYPKKERFGKAHPATRTFQALRLAVNQELEVLESVIGKMIEILEPGARFCVISFHSLEDRIVKNIFRDYKKEGVVKVLTKKPELPSAIEIDENLRSRSAKLRVCEKL